EIHWADVWVGAVVTAILFTAGNYLVGTYLARLGIASAYGPAGAWLVLLLWAFYASQAFLYGAAFTRVYANERGQAIRPAKGAVRAPDAGRA
ncbi:MAG TPA: YhjD/YihY/BrkB family envelope integrity protein, partial [Gemmataceae bacterium]|nr:YhjD/YihY/BrkB family envelope integrity protein [Gemmataceae bacterium]